MRQSDRVIPRRPTAWWRAALPLTAALLLAPAGAARHPIPSALAQGTATGAVEVRGAGTRGVPAGAPTAVGYLVLRNTGAAPDRPVAFPSPAAERAEVHEAHFEGDIARMRPVTGGVAMPAGGTVRFAPGGLHLMLARPREALRPGERGAGDAAGLSGSGADRLNEREERPRMHPSPGRLLAAAAFGLMATTARAAEPVGSAEGAATASGERVYVAPEKEDAPAVVDPAPASRRMPRMDFPSQQRRALHPTGNVEVAHAVASRRREVLGGGEPGAVWARRAERRRYFTST